MATPRPAKTLVYATVEGGQALALDVYRPGPATPATGKVPAVIVVHGGGWSADDKGDRLPDLVQS